MNISSVYQSFIVQSFQSRIKLSLVIRQRHFEYILMEKAFSFHIHAPVCA